MCLPSALNLFLYFKDSYNYLQLCVLTKASHNVRVPPDLQCPMTSKNNTKLYCNESCH